MNAAQARVVYRAQMEDERKQALGKRKRKFKAMIAMIDEQPAADLIIDPKNTYVWSDLHLGHANIIDYAQRPFKNVEEMNERLWTAWEKTVPKEATIIIAGDVAMGRCIHEDTWQRMREAPGKVKHLIVGNHDLHGNGDLRIEGFDHVWSTVTTRDPRPIVWTHIPLRDVPTGWLNVHGHMHDKTFGDKIHINVSVEQTDYAPVRLDTLLI